MRHHVREACTVDDSQDGETDPLDHIAFHGDGHFVELPADWSNPEQQLQSIQFFAVLDACTDKLPAVQGGFY